MVVAVMVFTSLAISALGDLTNPLTRRARVHSPAIIETSAAARESTEAAIDAGRGRDTTDRLDGDPTRHRAIVSRLVLPPVARVASACGVVALGPHTGQQRGQNIPRTNTGWCIFSARPPQFEQAASTIPD